MHKVSRWFFMEIDKNIRKKRLEKNQQGKTNKQTNKQQQQQQQKQKQKNKKNKKTATTKKVIPTHFSEGLFTNSLPVSTSKICLLSTIHLRYGMMLFIMSHFFVKAIVFIELVKAVYFSILFTF